MRRLTLAALLVLAACKRPSAATSVVEEPAGLVQVIRMGEVAHAKQLGAGFYAIEDGAWRWTQGKFAVVLEPPLQASAKGATLEIRASIPQAVIEKLKDVTLSTKVNGVQLRTAHYDSAGPFVLRLDVPAKALQSDHATVEFVLDKVLPPRPGDRRELGLIVSSIGFDRKI